jgi:hypothetical protein
MTSWSNYKGPLVQTFMFCFITQHSWTH